MHILSTFVFYLIALLTFGVLKFIKDSLKTSEEKTLLSTLVGTPLLGIASLFIAAFINSLFSFTVGPEGADFGMIIVLLLLSYQIYLYVDYIREFTGSTSNGSRERSILIGAIIALCVLTLFMISPEVFIGIFIGLMSYIIGSLILVFTIATAIALAPKIENMLNYRELDMDQRIKEGSEITVTSNPEIQGRIVELTRSKVIIQDDDEFIYLSPKNLVKSGFAIKVATDKL